MDKRARKNYIALFFVLVSFAITAGAHRDEELFLRANEYYQKKEYKEAFDTYQSIRKKGPAVWHNLGNCAYYLNSKRRAYTFWQRALFGASPQDRKQLTHQISLLTNAAEQKNTRQHFFEWVQANLNPYSLFFLQLLCIFIWYMFWILVRRVARKRAKMVISLGSFVLLCIFSGLRVKYYAIYNQPAVMQTDQVVLFAGPNKDYQVLHTLHDVYDVAICQEYEGWCKIKVGSRVGWVPSEGVERV